MRHLEWMVTGSCQLSPNIELQKSQDVFWEREKRTKTGQCYSWMYVPGERNAFLVTAAWFLTCTHIHLCFHYLTNPSNTPRSAHSNTTGFLKQLRRARKSTELAYQFTEKFSWTIFVWNFFFYWEFSTVLALGMLSHLWGHNEETPPQPLVAGLGAAHFLFWKLPSCSHTSSKKTIIFVKLRDCSPHKSHSCIWE